MSTLGHASPTSFGVAASEVAVRRVRTAAEFAAVLAVRRRVFGDEQRLALGVADADDDRAIHALALLPTAAGPLPIGTGRLVLGAGSRGEGQIAWVASLPAYRGRGVGTALMRFLLAAADEAGAPLVALSAQTHALPFYRRLGFFPRGERFIVRGIEHQWMARSRHA